VSDTPSSALERLSRAERLFSTPRPVRHPAEWSPAILAAIAPTLRHWQLPVHDPFAGTGRSARPMQ